MHTASNTNLRSSAAAAAAQERESFESAIRHLLRSGARLHPNGSVITAGNEPLNLSALRDILPSACQTVRGNRSARDICPADYTEPFMKFIDSSPTVFHAVAYFADRLEGAGFVKLTERENWKPKLERGGNYYTTRNGSSIVAFSIPTAYEAGNGVAMAAGHIDALTARLKPVSKKPNAAGYVMLGVAPYAGGMNSTWWDRYVHGSAGGARVADEPAVTSALVGAS